MLSINIAKKREKGKKKAGSGQPNGKSLKTRLDFQRFPRRNGAKGPAPGF
jgi:hypothetical protein